MSLDDPEPPMTYMYSGDWARAEMVRRENADKMDEIDSVEEMMARRALPAPTGSTDE